METVIYEFFVTTVIGGIKLHYVKSNVSMQTAGAAYNLMIAGIVSSGKEYCKADDDSAKDLKIEAIIILS